MSKGRKDQQKKGETNTESYKKTALKTSSVLKDHSLNNFSFLKWLWSWSTLKQKEITNFISDQNMFRLKTLTHAYSSYKSIMLNYIPVKCQHFQSWFWTALSRYFVTKIITVSKFLFIHFTSSDVLNNEYKIIKTTNLVNSFKISKWTEETMTCKGCVMVRGLFYASERRNRDM